MAYSCSPAIVMCTLKLFLKNKIIRSVVNLKPGSTAKYPLTETD